MPDPGTWRFVLRLLVLYLLDWVVILGTIGFAGSTSLWMTPNARPFDTDNPSIQFPFDTKTAIPSWLLIVLAVIVPAALILVITVVRPWGSWRRALYTLNSSWLGLGLAIAGAMIITDGLKNLAGKPRPDMLDRCQVVESRRESARIGPGSLVTWDICAAHGAETNGLGGALDAKDLNDGFRSFPSGHCSISMAGLSYLAIWFAEFVFRLPIPNLYNPVTTPLVSGPNSATRRAGSPTTAPIRHTSQLFPRFPIMLALLICSVPILLALYICSTRYTDYRHHPADIFAGALIGLAMGGFGWRWYGAWSCVAGEDGGVYRWNKPEKRDEEAVEDDEMKRAGQDSEATQVDGMEDERPGVSRGLSFAERARAKGAAEPRHVYGDIVGNGEGRAH